MSSGLDEQDGACVFGALGSHSTDDEDSEYSQEADSSSTCNSGSPPGTALVVTQSESGSDSECNSSADSLKANEYEGNSERRESCARASPRGISHKEPPGSREAGKCGSCASCLNPKWKKPCQARGSTRPRKPPAAAEAGASAHAKIAKTPPRPPASEATDPTPQGVTQPLSAALPPDPLPDPPPVVPHGAKSAAKTPSASEKPRQLATPSTARHDTPAGTAPTEPSLTPATCSAVPSLRAPLLTPGPASSVARRFSTACETPSAAGAPLAERTGALPRASLGGQAKGTGLGKRSTQDDRETRGDAAKPGKVEVEAEGSDREEGEEGEKEEEEGEGAAEEDEENYEDEEANKRRREANIKAMLGGTLVVSRKAMLPKLLQVQQGEAVLRRAFKTPHPTAPNQSNELARRLAARKIFVPWGGKPFKVKVSLSTSSGSEALPEASQEDAPPPLMPPPAAEPEENPLVLWEPPEGVEGEAVQVDGMLTKFLRPHQREGVQFMFECVAGLRDFGGQGCILADDMGLGKTLQGISLLWTLLTAGHTLLGGKPIGKRAVIVCPTSLVPNWESECEKWLKGRVKCLALSEASRDDAIAAMDQFLSPRLPYHVMIVSYETFRIHAERFRAEGTCDLLICDEAHRLKNDATLTNKALGAMHCKRRVLLSGTPLQNHLDEFYAMVSFCNPGCLGTAGEFRRKYEGPILAGREPGASDSEVALGAQRSEELSAFVNQFILRRTNTILSQHLPPKLVSVVCCRLTDLQMLLYRHFLQSKAAQQILRASEEGNKKGAQSAGVLGAITMLKKLCNHPKLIYDAIVNKASKKDEGSRGFRDALDYFPPGMFDDGRVGRGSMMLGWEMLSGKFAVLSRMLHTLFTETRDRIVIVSNYTQTLDMVAQLCREKGYPHVRLDGTTTMKKRQKLVKEFNDPASKQFAFLLSSKAGGCGLNLVGANRLILFDPDWNPANDKQAAARVWRDGQKKRVFEYRFLSAGTIEEKVFQRQLSKEGLQQAIGHGSAAGGSGESMFSKDELRKLFTLREGVRSDTFEQVVLARQRGERGGKGDDRGGSGGDDNSDSDSDSDIEIMGGEAEEKEGEMGEGGEGGGGGEDCGGLGGGGGADMQGPIHKEQVGKPAQEELELWGHHSSCMTVDDEVLRDVAHDDVTFVFTCAVDGKSEGLHPHGYDSMKTPPPAAPEAQRAADGASGVARGRGRGRGRAGGFRVPGMVGQETSGPPEGAAGGRGAGRAAGSGLKGTPGVRSPLVRAANSGAPPLGSGGVRGIARSPLAGGGRGGFRSPLQSISGNQLAGPGKATAGGGGARPGAAVGRGGKAKPGTRTAGEKRRREEDGEEEGDDMDDDSETTEEEMSGFEDSDESGSMSEDD